MKKPYFKEGNFTLYRANCLKLLSQIKENSVDMVFADPPYNLSNGGATCKNGTWASVNKGRWDLSNGVEDDFDFHLSWIEACQRILKPSGTIWISGTYHSIYQCGFALQMKGFHLLNDIAWFKPNAAPNLSCRFFTASHETLIWARKDPREKHKFNYEAMKHGDFPGDILKKENKQMRSVWAISPPKPTEKRFGKHPTQKPLDLLSRVIISSTDEGDLIVDPFTGSSTTGLVANVHKRRFIGVDTEKKYLDLSVKRYKDLKTIPQTNDYEQQLDFLSEPNAGYSRA